MKKIFYKLFILGGLLTGTTFVSSTKGDKDMPSEIKITTTPNIEKTPKQTPSSDIDLNQESSDLKKEELHDKIKTSIAVSEDISKTTHSKLAGIFKSISFPTKKEIKEALAAAHKAIIEEQELMCKNLERRLMAPTALIESTLFRVDDHNYVHSIPHECFYFCTADALTIGYGLKIEFKGDKPAPEGIAALDTLTIALNGKTLSLDEKINLACDCVKRKNEYNRQGKTPLRKMSFENQREILFPKGVPSISRENALDSAQIEYHEKREKLLSRNPFLANSYFSQALGTDLAYQYGNYGVTKKKYYKNGKKANLSKDISDGTGDRLKVRKFLCCMAYKYHQDSLKRKSAPMSKEEQNAFTLYAVQEYFNLFETSIMQRSPYSILLMENLMTLVFMQNMKSEQQYELTNQQIDECAQKAKQLVYYDLFYSDCISQLPKKLQPITMVDAVLNAHKKLNHSRKATTLTLEPHQFMEKILTDTATDKLLAYNKKYKTNIKLRKEPISRPVMATGTSGRN